MNDLDAVGIRVQLRPLERAAFFEQYQEKKLKNVVQGLSGAFGNAATRIEAFAAAGGRVRVRQLPRHRRALPGAGGGARPKKREALLQRIQQLMHDKVMYAPIWQLAMLQRHRRRAWRSPGIGLIAEYPWAAPYEDLKLKPK